jgi:hypothetical protein
MRSISAVSARTWAIIFTLVVGQSAISTTALAQNGTRQPRSGQVRDNPPPQQQQQPIPFAKISGKVTNLQPGAISVATDERSYIVRLDLRQTRVTVVGEGTLDALKRGVLVQFESLLNRQLTLAQAPIEKLTILSPSARSTPGVISDTPKDPTKPFTVRGTISRVVGPQLTVAASRKPVRAELAEEASVEVEVSDFSLVAIGDKIDVQGAEVNPGLVHATDVKITLSKPLGKVDSEDSRTEDDEPEEQTAQRGKSRRRGQTQKKP